MSPSSQAAPASPIPPRLAPLLDLLHRRVDPDEVAEPDRELAQVIRPILDAISRYYFRAEVIGLDSIPSTGSALLVANHNGGITSFDPLLLGLRWYERTGGQDFVRFLGHDLMTVIPVLGELLLRLGMIRASHRVADRALAAGHKVLVFPGGNYEAFRPFSERHQVELHGRTGFVRLALRHRCPVLPVLFLGGHETFFVLSRGERLARWTGAKRLLRSDSFPLFLGLPWGVGLGPIFHLPLPAKLLVQIGEPLDLHAHLQGPADDPAALQQLSRLVQSRLQQLMDRQAARRRWPIIG